MGEEANRGDRLGFGRRCCSLGSSSPWLYQTAGIFPEQGTEEKKIGLYFGVAQQASKSQRSRCHGRAASKARPGGATAAAHGRPFLTHPRCPEFRARVGEGGRTGRGFGAAPPSRDEAIMAAARGLPGSRKQAVRGGSAAGTRAGAGATVGRVAGRPGAGRVRGVPADRDSR